MITLAPGMGSCWSEIEEGTWASQASSSAERVVGLDEYQEPAWLAILVVILRFGRLFWGRKTREGSLEVLLLL